MNIWVITEGLIGTENQCLGVAEALKSRLGAGDITVKRVGLRWPWRLFSPFWGICEGPQMLTTASDPVVAPWPDVVIAGGRKAIGIARYIRKASKGQTLVCLLQHPKIAFSDFDLVAVPFHDVADHNALPPNAMITNGAANRITDALLDAARNKWQAQLGPLPGPRTAVVIGGTSRTHRMGTATMDSLITTLKDIQATRGGSLMITVSRRTPADLQDRLCQAMANTPNVTIYTGQGDNPYHGFLAYADYIMVTSDSTSMISDAATVGKTVQIVKLPGGSKRHDRFMTHLSDLGVGILGKPYTPWRDADAVAERIVTMLKKRAE